MNKNHTEVSVGPISAKRIVKKSRPLLWLALTALVVGCAGETGGGPSQLPTLAPTQGVELTLPGPDREAASFSDLSVHKAAMRPGYEGDLEAFAGATRYWLDVDISPPPYTVVGQQTVRYVNATGDTLDALVFRLYPNALATRELMVVRDATVDGQPVEPVLSVGQSLLEVPLPEPLPPGQGAEVSLVFGLSLPPDAGVDTYARLGDLGGALSLPSFFPLLSVYDAQSGDWWREALHAQYGDPVFSQSALYEVWLTVPDEMVVATVGQTLDQSDNGDGTADYHVVTGPVRDFAVYLDPDYEVLSQTADGVTLNVYSLPGGEGDDAFVLQTTRTALDVFNYEFGQYPFAELDIVETDTLASGIEYPGLVVLSDDIWDRDDEYLEIVIAHEVAHQWWYSLVGNDQVGQPWLDEGLAQYAVEVYFRETVGPEYAQGTREYYRQTVDDYLQDGGQEMPVGLPVAAYTHEAYRLFVYFKAPLFFSLLEETYGQEAMRRFLHTTFEAYRYDLLTTQALQRTAEEVFGEDLDPLFDEWVGQAR